MDKSNEILRPNREGKAMTTQPKALRLAEILKEDALLTVSHSEIAYELERQHAEIERLNEAASTFKGECARLIAVNERLEAVNAELVEVCRQVTMARLAISKAEAACPCA